MSDEATGVGDAQYGETIERVHAPCTWTLLGMDGVHVHVPGLAEPRASFCGYANVNTGDPSGATLSTYAHSVLRHYRKGKFE